MAGAPRSNVSEGPAFWIVAGLAAKQKQFEFRLIFITLASPELNVERVRLRVSTGGHDVPESKIKERWTRSLNQLAWFLVQADQAALFVGQKRQGTIVVDPSAPLALREAFGLVSRNGQQ